MEQAIGKRHCMCDDGWDRVPTTGCLVFQKYTEVNDGNLTDPHEGLGEYEIGHRLLLSSLTRSREGLGTRASTGMSEISARCQGTSRR